MMIFGEWFLWAMFRMLALAGILLFALIIAPWLFKFLLGDIGVAGDSDIGIAIGFVGIVIGVFVAQLAQMIQEVNTYHFKYPPAANALRNASGPGSRSSANQEAPGASTPEGPGASQNQLHTQPWSRRDYVTLILPGILLIASIAFICWLAILCACETNLAYNLLASLGFIVAVASALAIILFWIVRVTKVS